MRRREFLALIGGAVAVRPLAAQAQQTGMPVIGFLDARSPDAMADRLRGFRRGLAESGYVEDDNVTILYRWAENNVDRPPELAAELVRRRVAVIIGSGGLAAIMAAKAATATIPILFVVSEDPVRLGLVKSLARPEVNLTGINFYNSELVAKQLELLRELVPHAAAVAVLVNPASSNTFEITLRDIEPAARAMGLQLKLLRASTSREIDAAFAALAPERPDGLFVANDAFFNSRRVQLVQLAAHHRLPAIYSGREYSEIGGLISYGTNIGDAYRRILKGAKPGDLPVVQSSKFELVINNQTARTLGLSVSDKLLVAADEVIE
jgi:putative tryptophan/tyrosine transport system substrate-binding protein